MRSRLHLAALLTIASCAWGACSFTVELPEPYAGDDGAGGGGEPPAPCSEASDCPGDESECVTRTCNDGVCGERFEAQGLVLDSQLAGDCLLRVCDGAGAVERLPEPSDIQHDMSECTLEICGDEGTDQELVAAGVSCDNGAWMCNGLGECVECLDEQHCVSMPGCQGGACTCDDEHFECELKTCQNGKKDNTETDVDCGGDACSPCLVDQLCDVGSDCVTQSCAPGGGLCLAATCTDHIDNGNETDVDCGGANCAPCAVDQQCNLPSDCVSGVCDGTCIKPTCSDGVTNGMESDIDCGGETECKRCLKGSSCGRDRDCVDGLVCLNDKCAAMPVVQPQP